MAESGQVTARSDRTGPGTQPSSGAVATLLAPDDRGAAGIDLASDPRRVRQVIGLAGRSASIEPAMTGKEPEVG